jgi:hypothetical protein
MSTLKKYALSKIFIVYDECSRACLDLVRLPKETALLEKVSREIIIEIQLYTIITRFKKHGD